MVTVKLLPTVNPLPVTTIDVPGAPVAGLTFIVTDAAETGETGNSVPAAASAINRAVVNSFFNDLMEPALNTVYFID
jgi:hypothetical protein